jgi:heme/copper-type cytochrome/quinol oxidase subunit 2
METYQTKFRSKQLMRVLRVCLLSILFISTFTVSSVAQGDGSPSLSNLRKNAEAIREKQAHDEFMSYIYMVVGFSIVIGIAWFTTVKARNRSKLENEAKMKFIQQNLANKKHTSAHGAHGHHVRR